MRPLRNRVTAVTERRRAVTPRGKALEGVRSEVEVPERGQDVGKEATAGGGAGGESVAEDLAEVEIAAEAGGGGAVVAEDRCEVEEAPAGLGLADTAAKRVEHLGGVEAAGGGQAEGKGLGLGVVADGGGEIAVAQIGPDAFGLRDAAGAVGEGAVGIAQPG